MSTDDRYQDKRIAKLEQQMASVLQRLEDLERSGSPDGIAQEAQRPQTEVENLVARVCQQVRRDHGDTQSDLVGG